MTKIKITGAEINKIRLREPLEIHTIQSKKCLKLTNELGYDGHMLPILINYKVSHHTLTYCEIITSVIIPIHITYSPTWHQWRLMICIAIDNGSNNTVGGSY